MAPTDTSQKIGDAGNTLRNKALSLILSAAHKGWEVLVQVSGRWQTNMDPVYVVVKRGSTRYCALNLGQAQDIDKLLGMARRSSG
jgi:hypothetical protein